EHGGADAVRGLDQVDDAAPVVEVEVAGDVALLQVQVDQADRAAGLRGGAGQLHHQGGGADPALGAGEGEDAAAPPRGRHVRAGLLEVPAQRLGPLRGLGDPGVQVADGAV